MRLLFDSQSIGNDRWDELTRHSPVASVFQTSAMLEFYRRLNYYDVEVVAVEENDRITGLLLSVVQCEGSGMMRKLTSRAIVNGGPLLDSSISDEALEMLLSAVSSHLRRKCIYIETRNLCDYSRWKHVFMKSGFQYKPHYNFHLDTNSREAVYKRMDNNRRRCIRRAKENGAYISTDTSDLNSFYSLLEELYHSKVHKPLPPYSMFQKLVDEPFAHYFFVKDKDGRVVGGHLTLSLDTRVIYSWYCCGLDHDYHALHPSILANAAAIDYALQQGIARYDMMGAGTPGDDYGVRSFKSQFGGLLVENGRFLKVNNRLVYSIGTMAISLLKRLKK